MKKDRLFEQFPPVATEDWLQKIREDLKGADFSRKMIWKACDGIDVMPFYRREDTENLPFINTLPGQYPYNRGTKINDNSWLIRQNIEVSDYSAANKKAIEVLMKGIDSLGFIINDPASVSLNNLHLLLDGIHLRAVEINFFSNGKAVELLEILKRLVRDSKLKPDELRGAIEADPLGRLLANGTLCIPVEDGMNYLAKLTQSAEDLPLLRTIHLNASHTANSGADYVQELVYALAAGSEYLTQLTDRNIDARLAASKIRFSFSTGPDYFPEIAKLRAARMLWSLILKGFIPGGHEDIKMEIHSVTNRWNKTVYDPWVNMLRTQTEAMSAILGGADSVTVEPYDTVFRKPDEFSERIARNQQLILKEEAYFDKVADPAAGSYYIENLTSLIADKAWKAFTKISENGGLLEAMKTGSFQKELAASALKRKKNASSGKLVLLGTNKFPNTAEKASEYADVELTLAGRKRGDDLLTEPVIEFRASEDIEKIRLQVEKSGMKPKVFMLTTGDKIMRRARSQFAVNFFGVAAYTTIDNDGFVSVGEGVKAALESKADIVVLCSSDEEYAGLAPEAYNALKGKAIFVVAGNPPCAEELKAKGIEHFIHIKSDLVETLGSFNKRLLTGR